MPVENRLVNNFEDFFAQMRFCLLDLDEIHFLRKNYTYKNIRCGSDT
jgi:hypothetical protein